LAATRAPEHKLRVVEHQITTLLERGEFDNAMEVANSQDIFTYGKFSGLLVNRLIDNRRVMNLFTTF
jgi:hypothetical protein